MTGSVILTVWSIDLKVLRFGGRQVIRLRRSAGWQTGSSLPLARRSHDLGRKGVGPDRRAKRAAVAENPHSRHEPALGVLHDVDGRQLRCIRRGEGANVLPWRGKLYASACLDLRGLDGGRNAGSKRLSNIPERAAVALMKLRTGRAALFGFDPDHCPIIASVRLRGTGNHPPLDQPISSTRRLPMGSLEPVRGLP